MNLEIEQRAQKILQLVVEAYIDEALPVSSTTVAKRGRSLHLSPATIRSVMAELERRGLLSQPHTSAGRVPTELGMRAYLDGLIDLQLGPRDRTRLDQSARAEDPAEFPEVLGQKLAGLAGQVAVVAVPRFIGSRMREVGLVRLGPRRFFAYFVAAFGLVQQKLIEVDFDLSASELLTVQNYLNESLRDRSLDEARAFIREQLARAQSLGDHTCLRALTIGQKVLPERELRVHIEGTTHLIDQPEFTDHDKLRAVLHALDDKTSLLRLLERILDTNGVQVVLNTHEPPPLAWVGANVLCASGRGGAIALLGPLRMNYVRVVPMVRYASQLFDSYWQRIAL